MPRARINQEQADFMRKNAIHFEADTQAVGTFLKDGETCTVVSAGHTKHEYTTGCSHEKIM